MFFYVQEDNKIYLSCYCTVNESYSLWWGISCNASSVQEIASDIDIFFFVHVFGRVRAGKNSTG